jgi:hypothetical protein
MAEFLLLVLLVAGIVLIWQRLPSEEGENCCEHCGYDLRASTGRCPECGMPFTRPGDFIPLRDEWPADRVTPRTPRSDESPVVVHETPRELEARRLAEQLEFRGVMARVTGPGNPPPEPYGFPLGPAPRDWQVIVWSGDRDMATDIRDRLIPAPPPPADL